MATTPSVKSRIPKPTQSSARQRLAARTPQQGRIDSNWPQTCIPATRKRGSLVRSGFAYLA